MAYFQNIHSLADLKKEYRRLALQHHPDKGGDTAVMQQVNIEFEKLFELWKDSTGVSGSSTGYEHDYSGATAKEYTEYVYNEYRWKGRNYKGQHAPEIVELVRAWLKETYPKYKFSVRRENYHSIYIKLMSADFEAFTKESGKVQDSINHYNIERNPDLTDRAREVMMNVCDCVMSYNFDDSDAMTDYFHTNFYLTLGIGSYRKPYKVELPKLQAKGKQPEAFRHPEGTAHKAIRQALGKARFDFSESLRHSGKLVLGEDAYGSQGEHYFWPKQYSSAKTAQKRIDKLSEAGMQCRLTGYNGGCIEFMGYTPETEERLEQERQEFIIAHRQWQAGQAQTN
ncbi:LPD29 domain-containing protein [Bacteroides stercorirosoris]|uniref:LPD29 domain-containing protein n=1 Tax=Bacteroides stercorirosoris TaxID=871324 RepID=UPI0035224016